MKTKQYILLVALIFIANINTVNAQHDKTGERKTTTVQRKQVSDKTMHDQLIAKSVSPSVVLAKNKKVKSSSVKGNITPDEARRQRAARIQKIISDNKEKQKNKITTNN